MVNILCIAFLLLAEEGSHQDQIRLQKEKMERAHTEEVSILLKISQLERLLYQRDAELGLLKKTQEKLAAGIAEKEEKVASIRSDVEDQRFALITRARALFKFSRNGMIKTIFGSESFDDLFRRVRFTTLLLEHDKKDFMRFSASLGAEEKEAEELRRGQTELQKVENEIELKRKADEAQKKEKASLLSFVREEKALYRKALKEMEEAGGEIEGIVGGLKKETVSSIESDRQEEGFSELKSRLPLPVQGRIIGFFGKSVESRYHTAIFRKGIVIDAKEGEDVRAVAGGKVIYTGWFRGYGLIVLLDHGEGYFTLYAHLSSLLVDLHREVKAGDVIAKVGDSGSLEGPGLYFEIRYHGKPMNPLEWIEVAGRSD